MVMMNIVIGQPAVGKDFFGREKEQKQIWRKLNSQNLLMLAPRRIGKTSLLKKLQTTAHQHNKLVLYTSFAGCTDELACVDELMKSLKPHKALGQQVSTTLTKKLKAIKGFKLFGVGIDLQQTQSDNWPTIANEWLSSFVDVFDPQKQLVICVDELPIFILRLMSQPEGIHRVKHFLNWFRDIRQTYSQQIRWILAGSIGLDTVTQRFNIGDTINDLMPYPLGSFSDAVACEFIDKLAASEQLTLCPQSKTYLLQKLGWNVPYYIQIMIDALVNEANDSQQPITHQDIDNAFESKLRPEHKMYFDYWRQRLSEELGKPDDAYAIELLNHICNSTTGVSKDNLLQVLYKLNLEDAGSKLRYLLDTLQSDGYLIEQQGMYRFRLTWLQVYWQRRVAV